MGGAKKLISYLNKKDKYGVAVGTWAIQGEAGIANCKYCKKPIKFGKGVGPLFQHSETDTHIRMMPKTPGVGQLTLQEALSGGAAKLNEAVEKKVKSKLFQLELVRSFSRHRVPFEVLDCLVPILKKHIKDDVVQDLKLHHTKGAYLVKNAVSVAYKNETTMLLKGCDSFVVGFDESEINKTSELELLVKLAHLDHGIQLRHYRSVALESGDAKTITDTILEVFQEDGIDYLSKLLGAMSDGCNVMEGKYNGVKKRLIELVPGFIDIGSCSSHHIGNSFKYAVLAFDADSHEALVNIFFDIGGAKGRGLKRRKAFEKVASRLGMTPAQLKKVCTTRFRSYRIAIKPVLSNWPAVVAYYRGVSKPTDRQENLKEYFVNQEFMTKLKLNFIWAASKELIGCLDFFELREVRIYEIHERMVELLTSSLKRHQQAQVVETIDEDGKLQKKNVREILDADPSHKDTKLPVKEMFVGAECSKLIRKLGLKPSSPQVKWFYDKVYIYYETVSRYLQKYFRKGLLSTNLTYMKALSPKNRSHYTTSHMLKYLASSFEKVVDNIQPIDGLDAIQAEIDTYVMDESLEVYNDLPFEQYWDAEVGKVLSGEWAKYDILPRFALALGTFFNSNSETERAFSVETDVHRDPKKNRMSQDMLDSHMQVRYGVESEMSYDKNNCTPCNSSRKRAHCHCSSAVISEEMLRLFDGAYKEEAVNGIEEDEADISSEKKDELEQSEDLRISEMKEKLLSRKTFYKEEHMMGIVYKKQDKKSSKEEVHPVDKSGTSGSPSEKPSASTSVAMSSSASKKKVDSSCKEGLPSTKSTNSKTKVTPRSEVPKTNISTAKKKKKKHVVVASTSEEEGSPAAKPMKSVFEMRSFKKADTSSDKSNKNKISVESSSCEGVGGKRRKVDEEK